MPLLQRAIHCLLVLSLVILVPASPVAAQGTAGVFPDPLDWSSFQTILDPLELSPEQIAALEASHSNYLEVMMTLRDGPIGDFMVDHDRWFKIGDHTVESTKERIGDYRRITTRFDSNESNLFDAVESVLGPSQAERLQIVRDWRERQRKLDTPWPWQSYSPQSRITRLELRQLIDWEELNDAQRITVEQALANHEGLRTRLARQLHDQRLKGRIREVEIEEELGPIQIDKNPDMDHEEGWRRWETASLERHRAAYEDAIKTDVKLREALHRGLEATVAALPDRQGRDLRWDTWSRAYSIEQMKLRPTLIRAIDKAHENIDAAALEALLATHDAQIRPIHERAVEYYDQQAAEESGSMVFMKMEEEDAPILEIQADLHDRNVETARAFNALLGTHPDPGLTRYLAAIEGDFGETGEIDRYGDSGGANFKVTTTITTDSEGDIDEESDEGAMQAQQIESVMGMFGQIPNPISSDALALLARDIGAEQEDRDIIDMLHESYAASAMGIQAEFEQAQKAQMMKMAAGTLGGQRPDKSGELFMEMSEAIGAVQESSVAQLRGLDDQLFDDLVLAIDDLDDQIILQWHRLARQRLYSTASANPMGGVMRSMSPQSSMASEIDFMNLLEELELDDEARRAALQSLADWHEPATNCVLAMAEIQDTESRMLGEMMTAKVSGDSDPEQAMKLWEQLKESGNQRTRLQDEARDRNNAAAASLRAVLNLEDTARFDRIWRERLYPMIYSDPGHMGGKLMAAMALDGLDEAVRAELLALHDDYTRRYEACCDQMVVQMELMPDPKQFGIAMPKEADFDAIEQAKNESERIRFERDDLSAKTRGRLQNLLTEAQIREIGGLKTPRTVRMPWDKF